MKISVYPPFRSLPPLAMTVLWFLLISCTESPEAPVRNNPFLGDPFVLTATMTVSGVALSWNEIDYEAIIGYKVYRSQQTNSGYLSIKSTSSGSVTHTDSSIVSNATYYYYVTASLAGGEESGSSDTVSVAITGAVLCLTDTTFIIPPGGDEMQTVYLSNCSNNSLINWTVENDSSWLVLSKLSGDTPDSVTLMADTCRTGTVRQATLVFSTAAPEDPPETLTVSQPSIDPALEISNITGIVPAEGGAGSPILLTNTGNDAPIFWSVTVDSSWLIPDSDSGWTPGSLTMIADSNLTGLSRTAEVVVRGWLAYINPVSLIVDSIQMPYYLDITQSSLPVLLVSDSNWIAPDTGGSIEIDISTGETGSTDFLVTVDSAWLHVAPTNGTTPGNITISADTNMTGFDRSATVTIDAGDLPFSPKVMNITQPTMHGIVLVNRTPTYSGATDIYVSGNYAYILDRGIGLLIYDISDMSNPIMINSIDPQGTAWGFDIVGNLAYIASGYDGKLQIVDISNIQNLVVVGDYTALEGPREVLVLANLAYIADGYNGLVIIDISVPASCTYIGMYGTRRYMEDIAISGNLAYIAEGDSGLAIVDISNPAAPVLVGTYQFGEYIKGVQVQGDYAFIAGGYAGFCVLDILNPASPALVATDDSFIFIEDVELDGNISYVLESSANHDLHIYDISIPSMPQLLESHTPGGNNDENLFINGDYIFIGDEMYGFKILKYIP